MEILRNQGNGTYVFENLAGNVKISIYNSPDSYHITVINGPGSVIGCCIHNHDTPANIYFSDAYINKSASRAQSSAAKGIPEKAMLELKLVVYKSTVSSAVYRLIEALELDFWDVINNYKEHFAVKYIALFMLD